MVNMNKINMGVKKSEKEKLKTVFMASATWTLGEIFYVDFHSSLTCAAFSAIMDVDYWIISVENAQ